MPRPSLAKLHPHLAHVGIDRSLNSMTIDLKETIQIRPINQHGIIGTTYATYQINDRFYYTKRLAAYTDAIKDKRQSVILPEVLPPPAPPRKRKRDVFYLGDYEEVDWRAVLAPSTLMWQSGDRLVEFLIDDLVTDFEKVRALFRWATAQNPYTMQLPDKEPETNTPAHELMEIARQKSTYAKLFSFLCRYAGLPCMIISGILKDSTYKLGQELDERDQNGQWNAVLLNGEWRFVNCYLGSCLAVKDSRSIAPPESDVQCTRDCDENYFLTDPDQLLASHFPNVDKWQLLEVPITLEQFQGMAYLKERYFNLDMSLITHSKCVVKVLKGEVDFRFGLPKNSSSALKFDYVFCRVSDNSEEPKQLLNSYVFLHRIQSDVLGAHVRVPESGVYQFELRAKDTRLTDSQYNSDGSCDVVVIYKVIAESVPSPSFKPFPKPGTGGWGCGYSYNTQPLLLPVSHTSSYIKTQDGKIEVRFRMNELSQSDIHKVRFYHELKDVDTPTGFPNHAIHWIEKGQIVFQMRTPSVGDYALNLRVKINNAPVRHFYSYLVQSDQVKKLTPFPNDCDKGLGGKPGLEVLGMTAASHKSPVIRTYRDYLEIIFKTGKTVDLFAALCGKDVKPGDNKRLIHQACGTDTITLKIFLPKQGMYLLKVVGIDPIGLRTFQSIYDYLIDFKSKRKKRSRSRLNDNAQQQSLQHNPRASYRASQPNSTREHRRKLTDEQQNVRLNEGGILGEELKENCDQYTDVTLTHTGDETRERKDDDVFVSSSEQETNDILGHDETTVAHPTSGSIYTNLSPVMSSRNHQEACKMASEQESNKIEGRDLKIGCTDSKVTESQNTNDSASTRIVPFLAIAETSSSQSDNAMSDVDGKLVNDERMDTENALLPIDITQDAHQIKDSNDTLNISRSPSHPTLDVPKLQLIGTILNEELGHEAYDVSQTRDLNLATDNEEHTNQTNDLNSQTNLNKNDLETLSETATEDSSSQPPTRCKPPRDENFIRVRRRVRVAIGEKNEGELISAIEELKSLDIPNIGVDINSATKELSRIHCTKELDEAVLSESQERITQALDHLHEQNLETRLRREMLRGEAMLLRIHNRRKMLHGAQALDQSTISEIRAYKRPPECVIRVMEATLLLLGHYKEETQNWPDVQMIMGRTGRDAMARRIEELDPDEVALDVARGAKQILKGITLETVLEVSAGAAAFYKWSLSIIGEIERDVPEDFKQARPRTMLSTKSAIRPKSAHARVST